VSNRLKAKLRRGEPAAGVSVMIPSPQIVEMLGRLGFDWVLLDCEHGTISLETLELMTMAAEAAGITAIGRPRDSSQGAILEVLERGVAGVQVPHVRTADEAQAVVESTKYHPLGRRGLAARTRPAGYGLGGSLADYTRTANEETLVCIQVEDREALENLQAILEVEGVDVVFLGPSDLSQSFGHPGDTDRPAFREAIHEALEAIRRSGRAAGSAGDIRRWQEYRRFGATYLYTHLPTLLAGGSGEYLDVARSSATVPIEESMS
jgi:2-keto-3-deoxy-L-rhamnonate aldolase RhmA